MTQELLIELVKRASADQAVASILMGHGLQMLVYPLEQGILVGVGVEGTNAQNVNGAQILHKRTGDMARFGAWMPTRFNDGSWYVVRRIRDFNIDMPVLDQAELDAAEELLS